MTAAATATRPSGRRTAAGRGVRGGPQARGRGPRARAWPSSSTIPMRSRPPCDAGCERLADPEYLDGQHFVAPGIGTVHGVRRPLIAAVARGFRQATRRDRPTPLLFIADRLFHEPHLEARWFAFGLLERTLAADPERTWQLLRRAAREAGDWITVDDLAHPYGIGHRRRAVPLGGARAARLLPVALGAPPRRLDDRHDDPRQPPHRPRARGRRRRPCRCSTQLMGDAEPDVQKALAWAYRSLAQTRSGGDHRRPPAAGRPRRRPQTTATAPG